MEVVKAVLHQDIHKQIETLEVTLKPGLLTRLLTGKRKVVRRFQRTMQRKVVHGTYKHWVHPGPWRNEAGDLVLRDGWILETSEVIDALAQS